ncbi:MAG: hypothetical protein PWQ84_1667 [Thermotogaceae bacterium]|jgi:GH15 family glucan-1,4-alpha-glucosidase|nr:hypothetical protein [Thermotogaceae bacterium]
MDLLETSIKIIKENQHESGAYIASPNFSQYGFSWLRDSSFIAEAMLYAGETESAKRYFEWVEGVIDRYSEKITKTLSKNNEDISTEDYLPTRYRLDGKLNKDNWENAQIDGYGTYLWAINEYSKRQDFSFNIQPIQYISEYLEKLWKLPCYDAWEEEKTAIHTSTLISVAAGLKAAEELLQRKTDWNIIVKYIEKNHTKDGRLIKSTLNDGVDASLLWAICPFKLWSNHDPLTVKTIQQIESDLNFNGGVKRYLKDSYYGGGSWILLSANLGEYYKQTRQIEKYVKIKDWIERQATQKQELPEQVKEHLLFEEYYDKWVKRWGEIAVPLIWSHGNYIKLMV